MKVKSEPNTDGESRNEFEFWEEYPGTRRRTISTNLRLDPMEKLFEKYMTKQIRGKKWTIAAINRYQALINIMESRESEKIPFYYAFLGILGFALAS